jgi:hypothetical protein
MAVTIMTNIYAIRNAEIQMIGYYMFYIAPINVSCLQGRTNPYVGLHYVPPCFCT